MNKTYLNLSNHPITSTVDSTSLNTMSATKVRFSSNLCNGHLSSSSSCKTNSNNLCDAPSSSSSTGDYSTSSEFSSTSHIMKNFTIGDRVFLNRTKQHGTIAYIGPTHFSAEDLVGVVLDSSSGKHDGSINGVRYFQCPEKRGLFCPIADLLPVDQKNIFSRTRFRTNTDCEANRKFKFHISDKRASSNSFCNQFDRYDRKRHSFRLPKTTTDNAYLQESGKLQRSWSERSRSTGKLWKDSELNTYNRIVEPYDVPKEMKNHKCNTLPEDSHYSSSNTSLSNSHFIRTGSLSKIKQNHELKKSNTISEMTSISASKLYDQRHNNNNLTNLKLKLLNSKYSPANFSTYTPNQSLFNVQFRNSLKLIKLKNKLNKVSNKGLIINPNDKDFLSIKNNLSFNLQLNPLSNNENDLLLMNNVIHCAQEKLSNLQNQVLQYHEMNVKLSKQLTFVKIRQQEMLCKLGERPKNDVCEAQQIDQQQKERIREIKHKLFLEYERSQNLAKNFSTLKTTNMDIIPKVVYNGQNYNKQTVLNNCHKEENSIVMATVHPFEKSDYSDKITDNNGVYCKNITCNNNGDNLRSQLDNTGNLEEIMKLRKQLLVIYESYQCHYQGILTKLKTYQQTLNDQMCETRECDLNENSHPSSLPTKSVTLSSSHYNINNLHLFDPECDAQESLDFHKSICTEHQILLKETKNKNYKLSMELSVLNAEITHLASRPERQLLNYLTKLELSKTNNDNLHYTIQNLEEQIARIHKELEDAKNKLNKEDGTHMALMRMNLRIHQLKQMEIKAHSLQNDQCMSIQTKEKELTEAINKMNLLSEVWANETQVKIETIQKLRENLKFLSDKSPKVQITNKTIRIQYTDSINNNGVQIPDIQEPHLPYSLFSALCKEIRRLQSRSVSLVEALDLLSTGSCNPEKLDHIKNLVFSSNQTKNTYTMNWKNMSLNNVGTNIKRNMDTRPFNTVRSVKQRNNATVSLKARSPGRPSSVPVAPRHGKHVTISDNRRQRISSCKNYSYDNSKNLSVQESSNEKTVYPNPPTSLQVEDSLPPFQQQHEQQQDLVQVEFLQKPQEQQLFYHYNLPVSFSPRVQRRPVSFYLSRNIDKFVKLPIPEADEEEQTDDDEENISEGEVEDEEEEELYEEENENVEEVQNKNKELCDNHIESYNHEGIGVKTSKERNIILISNQS
uniref:CAP-Gly domain-containing protein n=1 Tax=Schistosoma mansoni TaxID=6183 RepID=A0A3Q0KUL1_SCHMA